jgi:rhodanese-related sulfurtransferase
MTLNRESLCLAALLLTCTTGVSAAPTPTKATAQTKAGLYVTAAEAYEMLQNPGDRKVVLVDVRDPVEIMFTGYTGMADIHVPLKIIDPAVWDEAGTRYQANTNPDFVAEVTARLEDLGGDKDSHIIFMCRSGSTRSGPAADALYEAGFRNVYTMVDGFEGGKAKSGPHEGARVVNGWKNSGLPWGWKLDPEKMYVVLR